MRSDEDVLGHRHRREQHDVLERPRDARSDDPVGASAEQVAPFEDHTTRIGLVQTGDDVEERRLAGAVRADEPADRALLQDERHIVERNDPAETPRHVLDSEECHGATIIKPSGGVEYGHGRARGWNPPPDVRPAAGHRPRPLLPPAVLRTAAGPRSTPGWECPTQVRGGRGRWTGWTRRWSGSPSRISIPTTSGRRPIWPS